MVSIHFLSLQSEGKPKVAHFCNVLFFAHIEILAVHVPVL